MKSNLERSNHGGKDNQDRRIEHQERQVKRRELGRRVKESGVGGKTGRGGFPPANPRLQTPATRH